MPVHEAMQATVGVDDVGPRPEHEVIGVAKHDLGAKADEFLGCHGFDRAIGADRHENRGLDHSMAQAQTPGASPTVAGLKFELYRHEVA